MAQRVKHLLAMRETWIWSLGQEDPLEKEMATHSSILAWKIPWTEKAGTLQSMGSQRVGHDWVNSFTYLSPKVHSLHLGWVLVLHVFVHVQKYNYMYPPCHYSVRYSIATGLETLWALPFHLILFPSLGNCWSFYCVHSFLFSRISCIVRRYFGMPFFI